MAWVEMAAAALPCKALVYSNSAMSSARRGPISFGIAQTDDPDLTGRHTGVGFMVKDIDAKYQELLSKGVEFEMPPTAQPWGGTLALFKDPDGNIYYLDPGHHH